MNLLAFDFMAKNEAHCLYHVGFSTKNPNYVMYLHVSSHILQAEEAYGVNTNFKLLSTVKLHLLFLFNLFARKKIDILGAHLYQIILLLPFIALSGNKNITIHMHGQAFALRTQNNIKYHLWKIVSKFAQLKVSNPAWQGPSFVDSSENYNVFDMPCHKPDSTKTFGVVSREEAVGRVSYKEYVEQLVSADTIKIKFSSEYYAYSPSGRLSEALLFNLYVVALCNDEQTERVAKKVCSAYGVRYRCQRD